MPEPIQKENNAHRDDDSLDLSLIEEIGHQTGDPGDIFGEKKELTLAEQLAA